jgi:hypothetical protein
MKDHYEESEEVVMEKGLGTTYPEVDANNQTSFNFAQGSKSHGPITSHIAENEFTESGKRQTHCERILDAMVSLKKQGFQGFTGREIAATAKLDFVAVMRRMNDLLQSGKVVKGAARICKTDGKTQLTTWWLTS